MKRVFQLVGIVVSGIFLYLILIHFLRNNWSEWDVRLAIIGFVLTIPLLILKLFKNNH